MVTKISKWNQIFDSGISRRDFIVQASTAAGYCLLNCDNSAAQNEATKIVRALDNSQLIHGRVSFQSGPGLIDAYLARPKKKGRFPVVIVITGNSINEEYIQNTTAMLAEQHFIGIAPNIFSLQKDSMSADEKRKVFVEQITDQNIFRDLQSAIDYLARQNFARPSRAGIMGFCFGGRCALMFAAKSKAIAAVAPFYGNLRTPAFANRKEDPLDVMNQISVPIQGHYSDNDPEIPLEQLKVFEMNLRQRRVPVEIFTYPAPHGFFAYTRKSYQAEAAIGILEENHRIFSQVFRKMSFKVANNERSTMRFTTLIASIVIALSFVGQTGSPQTNNPAEPQQPLVSFNSGKGRSISGKGRIVSLENPTIVIDVSNGLRSVGVINFTLKKVAQVERYIFVDCDQSARAQRLFIAQFESILPGIKGAYSFPMMSVTRIGSHDYQTQIGFFNFAQSIAANAGAEAEQTKIYLNRIGVKVDDDFLVARYARVASEDKRHELIFFYYENLRDLNLTRGELEQGGSRSSESGKIFAEFAARAQQSFKVVKDGKS